MLLGDLPSRRLDVNELVTKIYAFDINKGYQDTMEGRNSKCIVDCGCILEASVYGSGPRRVSVDTYGTRGEVDACPFVSLRRERALAAGWR